MTTPSPTKEAQTKRNPSVPPSMHCCATLESVRRQSREFADPTIDVFVKRMPATNGGPKTTTNVWLLQGGPGYSSSVMENPLLSLLYQLNGTANIYTMDHRGTGRSTFLDCVAAEATTTGSPNGKEIDPSEVASCAQDLQDNAATDVVTFISQYTNGANTIVYGASYETMLVERLMHLNPPTVTGYVLDGVATASGAPPGKFEYMSMWETDYGEVGDRFLELCSEDTICSSHFKQPQTLPTALPELLADFDKDPNSTCATVMDNVKTLGDDALPSFTLRDMLGEMLMDADLRKLIPPVVYRSQRCNEQDVDVLTYFTKRFMEYVTATTQSAAYYSPLLYYLIVFSEMWETPTPTLSEMGKRFTDKNVTSGLYAFDLLYCAFSKEDSDELHYGNYSANGIIYERDEYWNKSAKIPSQASVLLLSSKLDPQTPHKYLLEALDGDRKELVTFNTSIHGALVWTQLDPEDVWSPTCGGKILASFVKNEGDMEGLDKSCVDEMPAFNPTASVDTETYYFSTDDVYDGALNSSLSSSQ
ncbi:hypothetical protein PHYSODRAFT_262624 [Phytophthora sojae]|uniref:AB hydrolase-1 domain-containing protein n=1 Tax=Phytophthora sojae (strain P6497) TaxID=1094619 RepID=G4ZDX5_PHYSP|nr:hypothetical protein PHYSODRAFT_262624 [Phytophthora sojae]EGZ16500.1 hypothetical protein PHYSODRAFT_262624 [Phytophthora sojae]|eukprot:XP_009525558.1 hypothetical protein PHYSODRAFT_262624 [Phytophthora sojae]